MICLIVWLLWQLKEPINIIGQWLNYIFIKHEVMWTIFGTYDLWWLSAQLMYFMTSGHFVCLPCQNLKSRKFVKHQLGKKTLLHTSWKEGLLGNFRERRPCLVCLLSGLGKGHRTCSLGGSGNMQLKYFFSHHFFTGSLKKSFLYFIIEEKSLASPCILAICLCFVAITTETDL